MSTDPAATNKAPDVDQSQTSSAVEAAAAAVDVVVTPRRRRRKFIDLGFLDDCEPYLLTNRYFPSKVGGKPAWLELANMPGADRLQCPKCSQLMVFFAQVYAANDVQLTNCFHRSLFVFVCKQSVCWEHNCSKPIVVFRSQLGRANPYYSPVAPDDDVKEPPIPCTVPVCDLCGIAAVVACPRCSAVHYCSDEHLQQQEPTHRAVCGQVPTPAEPDVLVGDHHPFLLAEYELVIEGESRKDAGGDGSSGGDDANGADDDDDEDDSSDDSDEESSGEGDADSNGERAEKRRCAEAARLIADATATTTATSGADDVENGHPTPAATLQHLDEAELAQFATGETDQCFADFRRRIAALPDQVIRYDRHGEPLWISAQHQLRDADVPACPLCGARRTFEFQIMPQMLNTIKDEAFDWGILAVYTCGDSCDVKGAYVPEWCYKQDVV